MGGDIAIDGVVDKKDMEETRRTFSLLGKAKSLVLRLRVPIDKIVFTHVFLFNVQA